MLAMAVPTLAGTPTPPFPTPGTTQGYSDAQIEFQSPTGAQALYLQHAPVLDFNTRTIALGDMYYGATTTTHPLAVVDLRTNGPTSHFNVTVALSQFKDSSSVEGLKGATLTFTPIAASTFAQSAGAGTGTVHTTKAITGLYPASTNIPFSAGADVVPAATPTGYGTAAKVFEAPSQSPINVWAANWTPATGTTEGTTPPTADIYIKVPGGSVPAAGIYKAKMEWSLGDTP